jgi:microcystin-dependent protein
MADPFLSEIRIVGFNFAPRGWAFCDGQLLPINQNQALYALLGTMYGGDGRTTFALPDMRGRTPLHFGQGPGLSQRLIGSKAGTENHTLSVDEIPEHNHTLNASSQVGNTNLPGGNVMAATPAQIYRNPTNLIPLDSGSLTSSGSGGSHNNMQPYLTLSFCIALQGVFPSRD